MAITSSLEKRCCPVCGSSDDSQIFFEENIQESLLSHLSYASRKTPEFMNFKLVSCPTCDLLYAPQIPSEKFLESAYKTTGYDSNNEAIFAAQSYAAWLKKILPSLPDKASALEVGSGNGAFLKHLVQEGFQDVIGVEPSGEAIACAPKDIKGLIKHDMFKASDFESQHFSLVTMFQTLEHIQDPARFFADAHQLLKERGALMVVGHNYRHWLMRLLGKKSPIIDIEHLQLFSPDSLTYALKKAGFSKVKIHSFHNVYPLHYWTKLLPFPLVLKKWILKLLTKGPLSFLGQINVGMKVGNVIAIASKS